MEIDVKIDTAVEVNVPSLSICQKFKWKIKKCSLKIEAFGGFVIKLFGKVKINSEFIVVETNNKPIMGL